MYERDGVEIHGVRARMFIPSEGISGYVCPTEVREAPKDPQREVCLRQSHLSLGCGCQLCGAGCLPCSGRGIGGRDSLSHGRLQSER